MKKHIALFSSFVLIVTALTLGMIDASAETVKNESSDKTVRTDISFDVADLSYRTSTDLAQDEVLVVGESSNGLSANLVIPETVTDPESGNQYTVVEISDDALSIPYGSPDNLKSVTLPKTIKKLGHYIFQNRSGLATIKLSEGLPEINSYAFALLPALKTINIPNTVTKIGASAFSDNPSLEAITIPDSVTAIDNFAFYNCAALKTISLSDNVTELEGGIFSGAAALATVRLPETIEKIPYSMFENCQSLKAITIPDKVSSIEMGAFEGSGLQEVRLPTGITQGGDVGSFAFATTTLEKIVFTSKIDQAIGDDVFTEPVKTGKIFEGWLSSRGGLVSQTELASVSLIGETTLTAQWKSQAAPGGLSLINVSEEAKIVFEDVLLEGSQDIMAREDQSKTTAMISIEDNRVDKSAGWTVYVKFHNDDFAAKGLNLILNPTTFGWGVPENIWLTDTNNSVFSSGNAQEDRYYARLNPELLVPKDFSLSGNQADETTQIDWQLVPDV